MFLCSFKKALNNWLLLYREELEDDYVFSLYKNGRGKHIIEVDKRLNNTHFFFLVNYLKHPEEIDYNPKIIGYTIAKEKDYFSENNLNTIIKVFMPEIEKIPDMVHVITENNKTFEIDFGGKVKEVNSKETFELIDFSAHIDNEKESSKLSKEINEDEKLGLNYSSFNRRFKIIAFSYILLLVGSIHFIDSHTYNDYFIYLIIMPFGWLTFEHDYLFNNKAYLKLLLFAIILMLVGVYVGYFKLLKSPEIALVILSTPLIFIILQKILSSIYIAIFKKRPDILNRSFVEVLFYQIPLFLLPVIISILLMQFINFA